MTKVHRNVKWPHIILVAVLPLALNIFLTTFILIYFFSLEEFLRSPFYYTYYLGPFLWSIYHVLLTGLVYVLLRKEDESLRGILGSVLGGANQ